MILRSLNLNVLPMEPPTPIPDLRLVPTSSGRPSLVVTKEGREISLHSRVDPVREASALAEGLTVKTGEGLVVLGLGLGYHLAAVLARLSEWTPVLVIEAEERVYRAAAGLPESAGWLESPRVKVLAGLSPRESRAGLREWRRRNAVKQPVFLDHPPSLRLHPEFYLEIKERRKTRPAARRFLPGLRKDRLNVLIPDTGYYLFREVGRALEALGHRVCRLVVDTGRDGPEAVTRRLLRAAASFGPDFLLTVNHLGFDSAGLLTHVLTRLRLPFASWFVDNPLFVLGRGGKNLSEYCSIFLWDHDYLDELKALGFDKVHYLPLGTDETVFRPAAGKPNPLARLASEVGFAGDSMQRPVEKAAAKLSLPPGLKPRIDRCAREFGYSSNRFPGRLIQEHGLLEAVGTGDNGRITLPDLEALITWRATQIYRQEMVQALAPLKPTVVGDAGWRRLLDPSRFRLEPELDYYLELPFFYQTCRMNLNATSLQMKGGVNQRIFDIPACGAFILTDCRGQIVDLFEVGREVVCYQGPGDILDLARYYLEHETQRRAVVERARARVLAEHTYRHRLQTLVRRMREDFK
ncbi:MAG: glycosyltransferase [Thermodesulfobacteriota bacterium]